MLIRRLRSGLIAAGTVCLAGCASFEGQIAPLVSLEDVADNIQCELAATYKEYRKDYGWLAHWASSFTITMKRQDKAGLTPKFDYLEKDIFGIGVTGELFNYSTRSLTTKRTLPLNKLSNHTCNPVRSGLLTGSLGLRESIGEALRVRGRNDPALKEEPDDLGYTIEFAIKLGAGVSPSWILTRIPGVGFGAGGSSETTHTLNIAFTNNAEPDPPPPLKVCFVDPPSGWGACEVKPAPPTGPPQGMRAPQGKRVETVRRPRGGVSEGARIRLDSTLFRMQLQNLQLRR